MSGLGIETIQALTTIDDEQLMAVDGVGEKTAGKLRLVAVEFLEELEKLEAELESEAFDEGVDAAEEGTQEEEGAEPELAGEGRVQVTEE